MRTIRTWLPRAALAAALASSATGCHLHGSSHVDGGELGRVVVYRNGVAFYERHARVEDGRLTVHVPRDRVDDFLKSLTVVDAVTKKPMSVTIPRKEAETGSYLTMELETPELKQADVLLTYVTEAPAWKPSYRVVVGTGGKVMLEGWAIVDNTSGEDWKKVLVGVGASSALAFRYDLWSVRQIDRDLLAGEEKFAIAPPTGVSPYGEGSQGAEELASLDANEVRGDGKATSGSSSLENQYYVDGVNTTGLTYGTVGSQVTPTGGTVAAPRASAAPEGGAIQGVVTNVRSGEKLAGVTIIATSPTNETQTAITDEQGFYKLPLSAGSYRVAFYYNDVTVERSGIAVSKNKTTPVFQKLKESEAGGEVIKVTDAAPTIDPTSTSQGITIDRSYTKSIPVGRTFDAVLGSAAGSQGNTLGASFSGSTSLESGSHYEAPKPPPPVRTGDEKLAKIVARVKADHKDVVVEVHGGAGTESAAAARGAAVRNQLVDDGVPAARIHVVQKLGSGERENVRVLAVAGGKQGPASAPPTARNLGPDTPVGESHFMADRPMTVRAGTSAMVAMVHGETTGGVVYLYDPLSERGDERFAFKSVRLDNPTDDTLEPGPVTVYGDGRFIGEGITEPVPPHAAVVVPFALDKQIVISKNGDERDKIAKLVTVQRGIVTAEVQHRRETRFTVTSRLTTPATVYVRHKLEPGWTLLEAPSKFTKVGDSQLFEVHLDAGETKYVTIAEATPLQRTMELASDDALDMMKVFIDEPDASPELKAQISALLATHKDGVDLLDKIVTLREQLGEYRVRAGELHAQVVTLRAVKTGGDLMTALKARLADVSEREQKATIDLVDTQEKMMLARVKFQNQLADLKLTDTTKPVAKR